MNDQAVETIEENSTPKAESSQAPTPEQPTGPDLNVNDLNSLKSIIDVASQRGAFKASEMEAIGKVYNRLNNFLESVSTAKKD